MDGSTEFVYDLTVEKTIEKESIQIEEDINLFEMIEKGDISLLKKMKSLWITIKNYHKLNFTIIKIRSFDFKYFS